MTVISRKEVLDHGFVELVDYMGSDQRIVDAARVSVSGEGVKATSSDRGLIRYLLRHLHTSPFEQCVLTFRAKMPMFIARQWVRHRTAAINEMSARYGKLPEEFYVPAMDDIKFQSTDNKQGSGEAVPKDIANAFRAHTMDAASEAFAAYSTFLGEELQSPHCGVGDEFFEVLEENGGIARELARINLPLNTYTQWYWTINLWNLMHFLRLRLHSHAQKQIRVYGDAMFAMVKKEFPLSMEAFEDYILHSVRFSRQEQGLLSQLLKNKKILKLVEEDETLSSREKKEFLSKLEIMKEYV